MVESKYLKKKSKKKLTELKTYHLDYLRRVAWAKKYKSWQELYDALNGEVEPFADLINDETKSLSWRENLAYSITAYFELNHDPLVADIKKIAFALTDRRKKDEKKNEQTDKEKENYLTQTQLVALREARKDYKTIREMEIYLVLCLITMQPPIRVHPYVTMDVVLAKKVPKDTSRNYVRLWKNENGFFSGEYQINQDKVSDTFTHKDNKTIPISQDLAAAISKSLKFKPRIQLFDFGDVKKKEEKLLSILREATENKFDFDMARSSYVNEHLPYNATEEQKEILAKMMRHSVATQQRNYRKVFEENFDIKYWKDQLLQKQQEIEKLKVENAKIKAEAESQKAEFDRKQYSLIYSANYGGSKIKDFNLELFDIDWDEKKEKYVPRKKI